MEHDIFISHSAHDKAVADAVCAALENAGIRCWIAPRDVQPGRPFPGEITRAIEQSKAIVLIFSAHSNNSEHVLREVQLAADSRLHIVQFRIDSVVPNDDLEFFLSGPHRLDALTPPLQRHLETLQCSIKALLSLPVTVDPRPEKAPVGSKPSSDVWKWIGAAAAVTMLGYFAYVSFSSHSRPSPAPAVAQSSPAASASATASPSITREPTRVADSPAPKASVALLVNQAEAESFIRSFYRDMEHDDADKVLAYFDETVDYYVYGRKEKAFIAGQLPQYFAAFPNRSFSVGEVRLQTSSTSGSVPVTFEARYSLRSLGQTTASTGRSHAEWDLVKRDGALKIIRFTYTSYPDAFPAGSP
jgi:TIR domain